MDGEGRSAEADHSCTELGRGKGEGEVSKETNASGVRTQQHDRCKESTAGGWANWEKRHSRNTTGLLKESCAYEKEKKCKDT
jgi:hypothetical protein